MGYAVKLQKGGKMEYKRSTGTLNANNQATDDEFKDILASPIISAYGFYASNVYFSDSLYKNDNGRLTFISATINNSVTFSLNIPNKTWYIQVLASYPGNAYLDYVVCK